MKKFLLSCFVALGIGANAQIFQENWDGNGPGISSWTVLDLDGNVSHYSFITNGWNEVLLNGETSKSAASTSWYDPAGTSNDWLISPAVTIPSTGTYNLIWDSRSTDDGAAFQDGYKVYITSTIAGTKPTNTDFNTATPFYSIAADSNVWKTNTKSLSAYAGKTIYFAIVNDNTDKNLLLIDNIKVSLAPVAAPTCTTLTLPADNATGVAAKPSLTWAAAANATSYDVYLDTNTTPTTKVATVTTASYTPTAFLASNTKYYWTVVPKNDNGAPTGCTVRSFTTKTLTPPVCPVIVSPANGATDIAYNPTPLSWTKPTGTVTGYDIYWGTSATNVAFIGSSTSTAATVTVNINNTLPNTTYYWKVVAKNSDGESSGCSVQSLTTMAPTYCSATGGSASFEKIGNVKLVLDNATTFDHTNTATTNYVNLTATSAAEITVQQGKSYTFTAVAQGSSFDNDIAYAWINFNGDIDFDDAGELVLTTNKGKSPWTGTIAIPSSAPLGTTRMRVRLDDSGASSANATPCGAGSFGQVIDYTLKIVSPTMAVSDVNKASISVYPNPFNDILKISDVKDVKSISVNDMSGREVKSLAPAAEINLSNLREGLYIVNLNMLDGSVKSFKAIKK